MWHYACDTGELNCLLICLIEEFDPTLQRLEKRLLLAPDDLGDLLGVLLQAGKCFAQRFDHGWNKLEQHRALHGHCLVGDSQCAAEDAAQHITPPLVARTRPVRQGDGQAADVVGEHAIGDVDGVVELAPIGIGFGVPLDGLEDREPKIGVVVAGFSLEDANHPLEAHASVYVLRRQGRQRPVIAPVELDEHEVPDLDDPGMIAIDEISPRNLGPLFIRSAVVVNLAARSAGSSLPHLPEVVFFVPAGKIGMIDVSDFLPEFLRLGVGGDAIGLVTSEDRRIQPVLFQAPVPGVGEQIPCPLDRLGLEIIAERPVAQHLEKRVVKSVEPDILQIVVLAPGPDALLAVDGPVVVPLAGGEEDILELVHPRVGEEQRGVVVGNNLAGGHEHVVVLFGKVIDELLSDFGGGGGHRGLWGSLGGVQNFRALV